MNSNDWIAAYNEEALLADGFEEALVGICERAGQDPIAVYDRAKCLNILISRDGMSKEEAQEYFEYNVLGSNMGENTPGFITFIS